MSTLKYLGLAPVRFRASWTLRKPWKIYYLLLSLPGKLGLRLLRNYLAGYNCGGRKELILLAGPFARSLVLWLLKVCLTWEGINGPFWEPS